MTEAMTWVLSTWAEPLPRAGLLLLASVLVAGLLDRLLPGILRLIERISRRSLAPLVGNLHRPVAITVLLAGGWGALRPLIETMRSFIDGGVATILVLMWTLVSLKLSALMLLRLSAHSPDLPILQPRTMPIFEIGIKAFAISAGIYFLLLAWGIDPTGWLASAGVVGLAVGFAAKDSLANLFAGLFIIADAPYKLGDYLQLEGGVRGQVTEIGLRSTRIRTRDDIQLIVPNSIMAGSLVTNESSPSPASRVRCAVTVAYGVDAGHVEQVLLACAATSPLVILDEPALAPRVRFRRFADSGIDVELLAWIRNPEDRGRAIHQLVVTVHQQLREADIEIPYPRRDLSMR